MKTGSENFIFAEGKEWEPAGEGVVRQIMGYNVDPMMLFSMVNMKLRDCYHSLDELCDDMNVYRRTDSRSERCCRQRREQSGMGGHAQNHWPARVLKIHRSCSSETVGVCDGTAYGQWQKAIWVPQKAAERYAGFHRG